MVAKLLTPQQKRSLSEAASVEDAVRQLQSTAYGAELASVPRGAAQLLAVEKALERSLVAAYERVLRTLAGRRHALVLEMLRRQEVGNLKAVLRGLATGADRNAIRTLLLPLGRYSPLPIAALLGAADVTAAVDALDELAYARPLRDALDRYGRERSLFPLEMALDLDYYRRLWSRVQELAPADRQEATQLLGTRYDTLNVDWLLRYKLIYRLSPAEIFNYTLPYGYRIGDEVIRRAAEAHDLAGLIAALPSPYRELLQPLAGQGEIWWLEVALERYLWRMARQALAGYPFHIGTILAYLWLKESEVHDLRAILEGRRYRLPPEETAAFLWGEL